MKRLVILSITLLIAALSFAQTQQGYVKTKGRMVDGKLVPGQGIKGATVTVQGRNAVLVNTNDGSFSFPVPNKSFQLLDVKKNGYQLVDADIIRRSYSYSTTPLYIVMETPDQQANDQLAAERKIRRTMQRKLEEREDEIEALKAQQRITEEEYRQALQKLYAEQEGNERLIADMAKQYAQMDYDQMDELNRRISDAIVNGRLTEADSLLHAKGALGDRIAEVHREQLAEALRQEQLDIAAADLEAAKAGTQKKLDDIADDCKRFFDRFKMDLQFDSAAYYIELRAELDTTMPFWQHDAAAFFKLQNDPYKAEKYYLRALYIFRLLNEMYPNYYDEELANTLNSLGILYSDTRLFEQSEEKYLEALSLFKAIANNDPSYESEVAMTLNNLAILFRGRRLYDECEAKHLEALEIRQRLAKSGSPSSKYDLAETYNNLGVLYSDLKRLSESEAMYLKAMQAYRELANDDPETYEEDVATALNNLANLYSNTNRLSESKEAYLESLAISRRMAEANPQAYEPNLAQLLNNIGSLYEDLKQYDESEAAYKEALEIRRRLAAINPLAFELDYAATLNNLGYLYKKIDRPTESEDLLTEAYEIYASWSEDDPSLVAPQIARTIYNLGILYLDLGLYDDSEPLLLEAKELYVELSKDYPQVYASRMIAVLFDLAILYAGQDNYKDGFYNEQELLPLVEKKIADGDDSYQDDLKDIVEDLSMIALFSGHFAESELYARRSMTIDPTKPTPVFVLAEALLMQGKREEAEPYFLQFKDEYKDGFLTDFDYLEELGVVPRQRKSDIERIKRLLKE